MPAIRPWRSESLPSVAETLDWSSVGNDDRQRAGLQHDRDALGLAHRADAGDLGARVTRDAVRVLGEVDQRERLELAVEDDREVLEVVRGIGAGRELRERLAAVRERLGDGLELLLAGARELHRHDLAAGGRVEVLLGARHLLAEQRVVRVLRQREHVPEVLTLLAGRRSGRGSRAWRRTSRPGRRRAPAAGPGPRAGPGLP